MTIPMLQALVVESRDIVKSAHEVTILLNEARKFTDSKKVDELLIQALATHQVLLNQVRRVLTRAEKALYEMSISGV